MRATIEKVRPFLQMDGGDIELVAIEDCNALVRLHGACSSCSISDVHMKMGVETAIKRDIPEFGQHLEHFNRMRSEQNEVTERPPLLDRETFSVTENRVECAGDAVNIRDDPKSHRATVPAPGYPRPPAPRRS